MAVVMTMSELPLYKQIQLAIKEQIRKGRLRPGDRIPSEKELAEQFHVSLITSKNALAGLADEGIAVRVRGKGTFVAGLSPVDLTADKPAAPVAAPRRRLPDLIGLVVPSVRTGVELRLLDIIESAIYARGYSLMLRLSRGSPDRERQAIRHMHENGASGLLLFPIGASHDMRSLRLSDKLRLPFVLIDRHYSGVPASSVVSDNYNGAAAAARELLLRGHGRIVLLTPPDEHSVIAERLAGFAETLHRHGVGHDPELLHVMPYAVIHGPREESIRQLLPWLRQHRGTFTAMVVLDRELALIARDALDRLAAPLPPADMVTFDNPGLPGISYIRQNETAIGERAVHLLMTLIQRPDAARQRMIVPTELVVPQDADVIGS